VCAPLLQFNSLAPAVWLCETCDGGCQALEGLGIKVVAFEELASAGLAKPVQPVPPKPEDYCTIMYTSGTTGERPLLVATPRLLDWYTPSDHQLTLAQVVGCGFHK
jgi:acyl-coenzyme A synthetase/AMP-(fatty) acid ligase